mgnify:FL=1
MQECYERIMLSKIGNTALSFAAWKGHVEIFDRLMQVKYKQSYALNHALVCAVRTGNIDFIRKLLDCPLVDVNYHDDNIDVTPLMAAIDHDSTEVS